MLSTQSEYQILKDSIFNIQTEADFKKTAIRVFYFQYEHIPLYKKWVDCLHTDIAKIKELHQIPFLPIRFFKEHKILRIDQKEEIIFSSSGTTGMERSSHYVSDIGLYRTSYIQSFEYFYGPISDYVVLALLPSYMERKGSSLIYMAEDLIKISKHQESGFYLDEYKELIKMLNKLKLEGKKVLLLGVSFALLDLAENFKIDFPELIIMETGGMKGRRKELIREELHHIYRKGFGVQNIHSEYGMTELLSQAYSSGNGVFNTPPWMKVLIRDTNDPLSLLENKRSGGVNVIDLANLNSCAFVATQDVGKRFTNGSFEILGRFDNSDIRGCNLLVI
ncbi:MAG: acyltransferase [Bacteroidales bacterium]|nr:acyltransferase [Bacteroidales bacterium]